MTSCTASCREYALCGSTSPSTLTTGTLEVGRVEIFNACPSKEAPSTSRPPALAVRDVGLWPADVDEHADCESQGQRTDSHHVDVVPCLLHGVLASGGHIAYDRALGGAECLTCPRSRLVDHPQESCRLALVRLISCGDIFVHLVPPRLFDHWCSEMGSSCELATEESQYRVSVTGSHFRRV